MIRALDSCVVCGCIDEIACPGGCMWVVPGLCSSCVEDVPARLVAAEAVLNELRGVWPTLRRSDRRRLRGLRRLLNEHDALIDLQVRALPRLLRIARVA